MTNDPAKLSILFCCCGNTCRSPMAQAVLQHLVSERGLQGHFDRIESAGTHARAGGQPNAHTVAVCKEHGIPITSLAQQVTKDHFHDFDYIIGMDSDNVSDLREIASAGSKAQIKLFGEYKDGKDVEDPFGGNRREYEATFKQVSSYAEAFLDSLGLVAK